MPTLAQQITEMRHAEHILGQMCHLCHASIQAEDGNSTLLGSHGAAVVVLASQTMMERVRERFGRYYVTADDLRGLELPASVWASDHGPDHSDLLQAERLSFQETQRLRTLGIVRWPDARGFLRITSTVIRPDHTFEKTNHNFCMVQGVWLPVNALACLRFSEARTRRAELERQGQIANTESAEAHGVLPALVGQAAVAVANSWTVTLSIPGVPPALILLTDAIGIKELFRLRDCPEGRDRRAALLHWVREHWRANRHDPETEAMVRQHLRGGREFDWFKLRAVVNAGPDEQHNVDLATARARLGRQVRPRASR